MHTTEGTLAPAPFCTPAALPLSAEGLFSALLEPRQLRELAADAGRILGALAASGADCHLLEMAQQHRDRLRRLAGLAA